MKALSDSFARFNISGLCLIAALGAGCTFDASQLRALPDGAVEPSAVPDAGAAGSGGDTANPLDAAIATGGNDGSVETGGVGGMDATSGGGGIGGVGGITSGGIGGSSGLGGTGGRADAGVLDAPVAQPDVPISGSGGDAGSTGGVGGGLQADGQHRHRMHQMIEDSGVPRLEQAALHQHRFERMGAESA